MATDYPIEFTDPDGSVRIAGLADFTDPDNQPAPASAGLPPGWSADGSDLDAGGHALEGLASLGGAGLAVNATTVAAAGGSMGAVASDDGTTLGFYSAAQVTQPVVPLTTPAVQDIIDALVALGLVSQSD